MNDLTIYKPEYVRMPARMSYGSVCEDNISFYPYSNEYWKEAVEKFSISLPKTILTLADGITVCDACGAKYAGKQFVCTNLIWFFKYKSSYHEIEKRGHAFIGNKHREDDYYKREYEVTQTGQKQCNSTSLIWDLQGNFSFQESFFAMLSRLSSIENKDNSDLARFQDFIPHSKYDMIDMNIMRNRVRELERQNVQMVEIIKQIATRMSQAGSALNIGNL